MKQVEVAGLFALAGVPVLNMWRLPNQYLPPSDEEDDRHILQEAVYRHRRPWWLVKTKFGLVEIGWRKRVIQIDWSDTALRVIVTTDDVTREENYVHAYSVEKALEYLRAWASFAEDSVNVSK